ncbi:MAG: rhodanese-like domain-containing protein, partial [Caldilineaceae bacterium]|nr:rhodanese-like domain-containing protein [Caldilineaceae bacterium]
LKLDGIFFALGTLTGIFFFGETVQYFETFWNSSYMGRFTLPQLFGLPVGVVVLGVVIMAIFMFWGAEKLEGIFGEKPQVAAQARRGRLLAGAGVLMAAAVGLLLVGQPTTADKWQRIAETRETQLADRAVQIAPAELLEYIYNDKVIVKMIDVRDEANYNVFHLVGATSTPLETVPEIIPALLTEPANTLFVVMSNDETLATEAWRTLVAESVPNAYILAGGINNWLDTFGDDGVQAAVFNATGDETLRHPFTAAVGSAHPAANPDPHAVHVEYVPKVEMKLKQGPSGGGCG